MSLQYLFIYLLSFIYNQLKPKIMSEFNNEKFNSEFEITERNQKVVSVGDWMITTLIMIIPIVNFVMLFVWALSSSTPKSKSNWAKASLIWMAIGIGLLVIFWGSLGAMFIAAGY